ncbi:hypothetical protein SpAn4DRAFT_2147 [Sporomusa ovata]|uniref:Uncharacterized protein n=1 Tax=Sporomusa ovata TaxID=2378 RepID=A0A0U1KVL1_9FIRM|nr:hypothetical protein SpAn4DRAFT_2147 [Sporomusa ovata]
MTMMESGLDRGVVSINEAAPNLGYSAYYKKSLHYVGKLAG